MGDWEEFCDANGMDVGSEDDYDSFIDSLEDEPKHPRRAPTKEIQPGCSQEELVGALLRSVCERGAHVSCSEQVRSPWGGDVYLSAFDDRPDVPLPSIYLTVDHELDVPASFLIDAMQTSGLPLLTDDIDWLAWDDREQRLKCASPSKEACWYSARPQRHESSMEAHEKELLRYLHRAALSTDHGKKPLLLRRAYLDDAMHRREFQYDVARRIPSAEVRNYVLAFYDSAGEARSIPLERAAELKCPIFTRTGAYWWCDGDLAPLLNSATLLVGGFEMAARHNPNEFEWYVARERGTIFHSAIERIEAPRDPAAREPSPGEAIMYDAQRQAYRTDTGRNAIKIAREINWSEFALGPLYLTLGGHPFDAEVVTTPQRYFEALTALDRFGYSVDYSGGSGVQLRKRTGSDTDEESAPL